METMRGGGGRSANDGVKRERRCALVRTEDNADDNPYDHMIAKLNLIIFQFGIRKSSQGIIGGIEVERGLEGGLGAGGIAGGGTVLAGCAFVV